MIGGCAVRRGKASWPERGDAAVGKSLAATITIAPLSALVLWLARRPYKLALDRVSSLAGETA